MKKYKNKMRLFLYVSLLIVLCSFGIIFLNFRRQAKIYREDLLIGNKLMQADSLMNNLLQLESDKRGFQVTGDLSYLKNFYKLRTACSNNIAVLKRDSRTESERQSISGLDFLLKKRLANLDSGLQIFRSKGEAEALAFMQIPEKKALREQTGTMIQTLKARFSNELSVNEKLLKTRVVQNIAGLIAVLILFIGLMFLAERTFSRSQGRILKNHFKFKEAQRIARLGSWEWDFQTGKLKWSEEQYRIFGLSREEFNPTMDGYLSFIPDENRHKVKELISLLASGKGVMKLEHEIIRKDGTRIFVYEQGSFMYDKNGNIVGLLGTTQDITDRMQNEKRLEDSLKKISDYKYALDNSSDISITDSKGIIIYANERFCKISGYNSDELIGKNHRILNSGYHTKEFWAEFWATLSQGKIFRGEVRNKARDGSFFWCDVTVVPIMSDEGKPVQFIAMRADITERKEAEEELNQAESMLRSIIENSADGIYQSTPQGRFIMANPAMAKLFGYASPKELIEDISNISTQIYFNPEDREKMASVIYAQGHIENYELQVRTKPGEPLWVSANIRLVKNENGEVLYYEGRLEDISERKKAEEEIMMLNKSLEQFANITAHDLQEPIRMVSGFLGLLDKKYASILDEQGQSYVHRAKDGADRMTILIRDLLEFSRSGNKAAKKEPVNLSSVLSLVKEDMSIVMNDTSATLKAPVELPVVEGTQSALYRLFLNLVSNGIKFRKKDTLASVDILMNEQPDCWQFTIQDNGIGVAEQDQPKLFQAFQRLHRKEDYPGTGLGLVTCKKIVETHGGKIWMTSEYGKGTAFHFTLPKRRA